MIGLFLHLERHLNYKSIFHQLLFFKNPLNKKLYLTLEDMVIQLTPVHKKGCRQLSSHYRPVSNTFPVVKVMESFMKNSISSYMYNNNLFLPNQHDFTARKSCTSQLLHVMNYWTQCLDNKYPVDVVYLDFHKAFNTVPH